MAALPGVAVQVCEKMAKSMKKMTKVAPNLHLKRVREQQGWSQEYVARTVGTDAFTVSRWERGVTLPSPHFRQKLSALFGLSVAELGLLPTEMEEAAITETEQHELVAPTLFAPVAVVDPAIPPPPAREYGLIGREDLLAKLKALLLSEESSAHFALNGLPGVGKTALATVLAHNAEIRAHFADGILWAGLGYEPDVLGLLSRWGTVLQCAPLDPAQRSRPQAWATSIHAAIGQRRMLLVIDDAWKIAEALAFQLGGPQCVHLVTTRFPEIASRFAPDNAIVVRELDDTDGQKLLVRLSPEIVRAEAKDVQALVEAVGGLPLALTLLGNFLRAQSHSGQPRRLRAALERLRNVDERLRLHEPQALIGRHPSLHTDTPLSLYTVIGMSDQQVSAEARLALRAFSVFPPKPNTFSEEAALAIAALSVETVDELTDAGLLESSGPGRYTMHQTIADYAHVHLTDKTVTERLVNYFVLYVESHSIDYPALDGENSNIMAALEAAHAMGMLEAYVQGVHAYAPLLITRGLYTVAETYLQRSLEAARTLKSAMREASAWLYLGKIAEQRGNYVQAQTYWQSSLSLARESGQQTGVAQTLRELGGLAWKQGQLQQAHMLFAEALAMLRSLEDQRGLADTLKNMGNLAAEQGQPEQAQQLYEEALALFRALHDQHGIATTMHNQGILARELGRPDQAYQLYTDALAIFRALGDLRSCAVALNNLGNLTRHQGQPEQARQFLEESVIMLRTLENRYGLAFTLLNLGSLAADQGHYGPAHQRIQEALTIFRDLQSQRSIALAIQSLGNLNYKQGHYEQAYRHLHEALMIFQSLQEQRQSALTRRELGTLARLQGQLEEADLYYREALALLIQLDDQREVAVTRLNLAMLARLQGKRQEADDLLMAALHTSRRIQDRHNVAHVLNELSFLLEQQEQWEQSLQALLSVGVGLALVQSPDVSLIEQRLALLRTRMGEAAFLAVVRQTATAMAEPAYGLEQEAWATALWKLIA